MSGSMRTCTECEKPFRVASHKTRQYKCHECSPRYGKNIHKARKRREDKMTNEGYKRLRTIEEKLEALEITIGIHQTEMNTVVGDIESIAAGLVEKAVKEMVEQIIDEKIADVKKLEHNFATKLATVNGRVALMTEKLNNISVPIPVPTPIPAKEDTKVLDPLTKVQKKRLDRLMGYMRYHGRSITRREAVVGVWHDVPKSQISKCLKLGLEHGLIELDEEEMEKYFKMSGGKTPDHGGPNRKLRYYRLKKKEEYTGPGSLKGISNPPFPYHPHNPMNPNDLKGEYYGDN